MTTRNLMRFAAVCVATAGLSASASADCVREPRAVAISKGSHGSIESYRCNLDDLSLRVEFLRLSDIAAPLLLKGQSSTLLRKTVGGPKLVRNAIAEVYSELLTNFGETDDLASLAPGLLIGTKANAEAVEDRLDIKKLKTLRPPEEGARFYPAVTEIAALEKNSVPSSLSYYYPTSFSCEEISRFCQRVKGQGAYLKFWRPLTSQDVQNFPDAIEKYNEQTLKARPKTKKGDLWRKDTPRFLEMAKFLAADVWPEDWVIVSGLYQRGQCGDSAEETRGRWDFEYSARKAYLDAVLIENTSKVPVSVESLIGESIGGRALRSVSASLPEGTKSGNILDIALTLDAGKRLLVPTRIVFVASPSDHEEFNSYKPIMEKAPELFKAAKLEMETDRHKHTPKFDDYIYGPELAVKALTVNSKRLNLKWPAVASTIELTTTGEVGSCPHLLSLDSEANEWIHYGKILHEASNEWKVGIDSRDFEGLRTHFRIEEREPEVAHVENASLLLKLDDASVVRLSSRSPVQGKQLLLGEALEIEFEAPSDLRSRVVRSTLEITGYYERYSNLAMIGSDSGDDKVCRRPALR